MKPDPSHDPTPWTDHERALLDELDRPERIQDWLDGIAYSADPIYRCPRRVMRDRRAHCVDGALFAAAALRRHGQPPLVVDLRAVRDDDHLIVVFRRHGRLGAVAKSNTTGLRYREPIHRTVRELALSYFELYFNTVGEKTLRSYSVPVDLRTLDCLGWTTRDEAIDAVVSRIDRARHVALLDAPTEAGLRPVEPTLLEAGFLGANHEGLHRP